MWNCLFFFLLQWFGIQYINQNYIPNFIWSYLLNSHIWVHFEKSPSWFWYLSVVCYTHTLCTRMYNISVYLYHLSIFSLVCKHLRENNVLLIVVSPVPRTKCLVFKEPLRTYFKWIGILKGSWWEGQCQWSNYQIIHD